MKLIKCKACEKEISKTAKVCPHCGELPTSSKIMQFGIGMIFLGFALVITIPILIFAILCLV